MPELRIVIVEDEPVTARNLAHMLQSIDGSILIAAMLPSVKDAIDWFDTNAVYDLILWISAWPMA
jgi:two-component system response regulator LytT